MLPDSYRLKLRRDFARGYARGEHQAQPGFILYWLPHRGEPRCRIGFSASKKLGGAVERNRVKRVLRHAALSLLEQFPAGYDYVFVIRAAAKDSSFDQLRRQISTALNRIGARRQTPRR